MRLRFRRAPGSREILLLLCALTASVALGELALKAYYARWIPPGGTAADLYRESHNGYLRNLTEDKEDPCHNSRLLVAHPSLGFALDGMAGEKCRGYRPNRLGFAGSREFPRERDPRYFDILVTGGSVAQQLSYGFPGEPSYLERELAGYTDAKGRKIRVFSAALGGWSYPSQHWAALLYGGGFEALVAIDGYNEALLEERVDGAFFPANFEVIPPLGNLLGVDSFALITAAAEWRRWILAHPVLSRSYITHLAHSSYIALLTKCLPKYRPLIQAWSAEADRLRGPTNTTQAKDRAFASVYRRYVEALGGIASAQNMQFQHFLQPIPALGKELTPEEKTHREVVSPEIYRANAREIDGLSRKGFPTESLTDVFRGVREQVYVDSIHCSLNWRKPSGYERISDRIAATLAERWGLKRTRTPELPPWDPEKAALAQTESAAPEIREPKYPSLPLRPHPTRAYELRSLGKSGDFVTMLENRPGLPPLRILLAGDAFVPELLASGEFREAVRARAMEDLRFQRWGRIEWTTAWAPGWGLPSLLDVALTSLGAHDLTVIFLSAVGTMPLLSRGDIFAPDLERYVEAIAVGEYGLTGKELQKRSTTALRKLERFYRPPTEWSAEKTLAWNFGRLETAFRTLEEWSKFSGNAIVVATTPIHPRDDTRALSLVDAKVRALPSGRGISFARWREIAGSDVGDELRLTDPMAREIAAKLLELALLRIPPK